MLGNNGIGEGTAARRYPEALLQARQGQGFAVLRLLQESEDQLKGRHPHRHIQGLGHEPGCGVAVTASE